MTATVRKESMLHYGFGPESMKRWKVCPACGTMETAQKRVCPECGKSLPEKTLFDHYKTRHTFCGICDTVVQIGTRFCPTCGAKFIGKNAR